MSDRDRGTDSSRSDSPLGSAIRDDIDRKMARKMARRNDTSLVRAIRGPIALITVGVLFALNNFSPERYSFDRTWPVLLIVFGLMSLLRRSIEPAIPPPPVQAYPPPYQTPYQPPYQPPQQASYAQSSYAQPPQPAKGGFGGSAPRPGDAAGNPIPNPPPGDSV
jgi:hypothetical protein